MRYDRATYETVKKWKRRLTIGGAVVLTLGLVGCGAGAYGLLSASKQLTQVINVDEIRSSVPEVPSIRLGNATESALVLLGDWVAAELKNGESRAVTNGLSCLEAIGGPDASVLLRSLAERASSPAIADAMRQVSDSMADGRSTGVAHCVSFVSG